jgi:hypothetical protein
MSDANPPNPAAPAPPYKWTVMVYMGGDNDLSNHCVDDLKEMKRVGSTQDVAIIAQFDRSDLETQRYKITQQEADGVLADDVSLPKAGDPPIGDNVGDPKNLENFICWAMGECPAKHYMLILYGHGSGVVGDTPTVMLVPGWRSWRHWRRRRWRRWGLRQTKAPTPYSRLPVRSAPLEDQRNEKAREKEMPEIPVSRTVTLRAKPAGVLYDSNPNDVLDDVELMNALLNVTTEAKRKIDILGMDACLMGMAEVCYQIQQSVDIYVASEGTIPLMSWPYHRVLRVLADQPDIEPRQLATEIVKLYVVSYADYTDVAADLSAFDLTKCDTLTKSVEGLAQTLIENLPDQAFTNALVISQLQAQAFFDSEYVDLYDFCKLLRQNLKQLTASPGVSLVSKACARVMKIAGAAKFEDIILNTRSLAKVGVGDSGSIVLASAHNDSDDVKNSHGLSIYLPWEIPDDDGLAPYALLEFAKKTSWVKFLTAFKERAARPN